MIDCNCLDMYLPFTCGKFHYSCIHCDLRFITHSYFTGKDDPIYKNSKQYQIEVLIAMVSRLYSINFNNPNPADHDYGVVILNLF